VKASVNAPPAGVTGTRKAGIRGPDRAGTSVPFRRAIPASHRHFAGASPPLLGVQAPDKA